MTTPSVREALACPFCGHAGLHFADGSTFRWLAYSCGGCGVGSETRMQTMGEGTREEWRAKAEQDAIEEWNRRALTAPDPVLPEVLAWVRRHGADSGHFVSDAACDDFADQLAALYATPPPAAQASAETAPVGGDNTIYRRLRDADARGLAPPQNWTTLAADEIQRLNNRLAALTAALAQKETR